MNLLPKKLHSLVNVTKVRWVVTPVLGSSEKGKQ